MAANEWLASTARWTAAVRARESTREDRLFDDPWAARLAGKQGMEWIEQRTPDSVVPMVIRTRFFDDFLGRVSLTEGIRQIVIVAAGLDTRAFRLHWSEQTCLYELDQPELLEYKQSILDSAGAGPGCARQTVSVDLAQPWEDSLLKAGFAPQLPAVWLLEGLLFYLPNETISRVLDQVTGLAAAKSWMGFDIINSVVLTFPYTRAWVEMQAKAGAPWIGTMEDPAQVLTARGWKATLTQYGEPGANFGRWTLPVIPTAMPNMPRNWLVTAQKD